MVTCFSTNDILVLHVEQYDDANRWYDAAIAALVAAVAASGDDEDDNDDESVSIRQHSPMWLLLDINRNSYIYGESNCTIRL